MELTIASCQGFRTSTDPRARGPQAKHVVKAKETLTIPASSGLKVPLIVKDLPDE